MEYDYKNMHFSFKSDMCRDSYNIWNSHSLIIEDTHNGIIETNSQKYYADYVMNQQIHVYVYIYRT